MGVNPCWSVSEEHNIHRHETVDKINKEFWKKTVFHLAAGIKCSLIMKPDYLCQNYTTADTKCEMVISQCDTFFIKRKIIRFGIKRR